LVGDIDCLAFGLESLLDILDVNLNLFVKEIRVIQLDRTKFIW
jgi:hypothetical protein